MIEPLIQTWIRLCWHFNLKRDVLMQTQPIFNFFFRRATFFLLYFKCKQQRNKWTPLNTLSAISSNTFKWYDEQWDTFPSTFCSTSRNCTHYFMRFALFRFSRRWNCANEKWKEDFFLQLQRSSSSLKRIQSDECLHDSILIKRLIGIADFLASHASSDSHIST